MVAMIDAQCSKCGKRFGWCGTMASRPACPRCGDRPPQEELDAAAAQMQEIHERLRTHPKNADAEMRRRQRIDAGLTLRQAAKQMGIDATLLSRVERGEQKPSAELLEAMALVYGVGI